MKTKKQQKVKEQILNTIPIFLAKTYKIVDNPLYHDVISWTDDGQGFIVKDINKLTTDIFPKHFKHSNFASFVRQLNMYGFHKIKSDEEGHAFTHQFFQKDQVQKLKDIKRRNHNVNESQQPIQTNMMVPLTRNYESEVQKEMSLLKSKHEDLQGFVSMLVDQNKEILMQNKGFVTKMSKMEQKYRNKLQTLMLLLLFGKAKNSNGQPFILPQQFKNMIESFCEPGNQKSPQQNGQNITMKKKKSNKKEIYPNLIMIKNQSEAQIQKNRYRSFEKEQKSIDQQKEDINVYFNEISPQKKETIYEKDELSDQLGLIPPSPAHSHLSFPQFYQKQPHNDVSQFLDKLQHSDYEDLGILDDKN